MGEVKLYLLLFLFPLAICDFEIPNMLSDQLFVHQLISNYLIAEQRLWGQSRSENILPEIYSTNKYFLNKTFEIPLLKEHYNHLGGLHGVALGGAARLFNSKIGDPERYPVQKDKPKPDILLSHNLTLELLGEATIYYDLRKDLTFWSRNFNTTRNCYGDSHNIESSYEIMLDLYEETQMLMLQGYITTQISYFFQNYHLGEDESYSNRAMEARKTFKERILKILETFLSFIHETSKDCRTCDAKPSGYRGYPQITKFLHRFVDNEVNLNQESSCTKSCSDYKQTNHFHCNEDTLCNRCEGTVKDCENSDVKTGSWNRWFVKCSNCLCICDETSKKDSNRYFSLRNVVSNISDNKIVTGVQIMQKNGIIQLNIAQRQLRPYGIVPHRRDEWSNNNWEAMDVTAFNISDYWIQRDIDYHELTYDQRAFNLDTVVAPKGSLVTGVRFRVVKGHLSLQIRATQFDFATGQLKNIDDSQWISDLNGGKNKIYLQGSKKPNSSLNKSTPYATENAYVEFSPGMYDHGDVQNEFTVPFFNDYVVEPFAPTILSGVGFILTGQEGYAGFIGVKLIVYDFNLTLILH